MYIYIYVQYIMLYIMLDSYHVRHYLQNMFFPHSFTISTVISCWFCHFVNKESILSLAWLGWCRWRPCHVPWYFSGVQPCPWYGRGSMNLLENEGKKTSRFFWDFLRKNTAGLIFGSWISRSSFLKQFFSDKLRPAPCLYFLKGGGGWINFSQWWFWDRLIPAIWFRCTFFVQSPNPYQIDKVLLFDNMSLMIRVINDLIGTAKGHQCHQLNTLRFYMIFGQTRGWPRPTSSSELGFPGNLRTKMTFIWVATRSCFPRRWFGFLLRDDVSMVTWWSTGWWGPMQVSNMKIHYSRWWTWSMISYKSWHLRPCWHSIESWLVDRDPYNGLLKSPYNWVV